MNINCTSKQSEKDARAILAKYGLYEKRGYFCTGPFIGDSTVKLTINSPVSQERLEEIKRDLQKVNGVSIQ